MKITQREMVLGVVTLVSLMIGTTWYVVDKKSPQHQSNLAEINRLKNQIRLNERRIKMQDEWLTELNELQKDLRVFPASTKSPSTELMKTVNDIARKHEFEITKHTPRGEKPTGDLLELSINCLWEGKLEAVVGFLAELQQQGVRYDVRSLSIQPVGRNTGRLKGNMQISCAYTRQNAE